MRENDDHQRQFRGILDSISVGQVTDGQYSSLMQWHKAIFPPAELWRFQDSISLSPQTRKLQDILRKSKEQVKRILKDYNNKIAR